MPDEAATKPAPEPTAAAAPAPVAPLSAAETAAPADKPADKPADRPGATARPDWAPEKFWDAEKGALRVEDLARAHTELGQRFAKGKEGIAAELRAELETEIRAKLREGVPEKPEGYALEIPKDGLPEHLVLLDKRPANDWQPEDGKAYFVLDPADPRLAWWRGVAHKAGLSQADFMKGVVEFAAAEAPRLPTRAEIAEANAQFYASLGERGQQRVAHLWGQLKGLVGDEARAFDAFVEGGGKAAVELLERLVEKAGGPRFNAGAGATAGGVTEKDLREKMKDPKYWHERDPAFIAEVTEGWKRLFPGRRRAG